MVLNLNWPREPSADEEDQEVAWHVELTGRIEEMGRQKATAAAAEEDYLTAGEIKRSIVELVEQS